MTLASLLAQPEPIIADGAWGTQLALRGLGSDAPESWNLTHPDEVAGIASEYAAAGAQIVLTNTFGGSRIKLEKVGLADHDAINIAGAELSKRGAAGKALVLASIGPTGELIGLTSTMSEADLEAVFAAQAVAILKGAPDGFIIETMADLTEAKCALRGVKATCDLPVAVSMTFDEGARGPATMMGVTPERAAEELTEAGADLVGANCGRLGNEAWRDVVSTFAGATNLPVWAKANAGIPELLAGESVFPMGPDEFAKLGKTLVDAGAKVVGGCCGTTPEHITALAKLVR
jgi:5-methyltetrahydrofolate--homocysteine methyltransferase